MARPVNSGLEGAASPGGGTLPQGRRVQRCTRETPPCQVSLPLFAIFKRQYLWNTFTGMLWMAMNFCVYYAVWAMLGTYLTKELGWTPAETLRPVVN